MASEGAITAKTDINIVNTALLRLNQNPIEAFGQNPGTGLIMQASYNYSRDALLRLQPWSFARKWAQLQQLNQVPLNLDIIPDGSSPGVIVYTGAYQLPNDCLRVFRFSPRYAHFRIVGKTIYTDAIPNIALPPLLGVQPPNSNGADNLPQNGQAGAPVALGIEYIYLVDNPEFWDSSFIDCFIWKLCKELSFGVTGLMQVYQMADKEYTDALGNAAIINGLENWPDPFWNSELNDVRYSYVGMSIESW